ncbi:MAG: hypothetical protein AAGB02_01170 [Pseudomonadota bacterium]
MAFKSHYKIPAPQLEQENCVAHNGSIVPVPGRDIFVQAWYQGGISVIDFTDTANPIEIAYFDRGPLHEDALVLGGFWSTYWYAGKIYGTEIVRGLDVLELQPSEFLTENEIAAALIADQGELFNPQQQFQVTWPATPVVARAYIDQLTRAEELDETMVANLDAALNEAASAIESGGADETLAKQLRSLASSVSGDGDGIDEKQRAGLADTLNGIAAQLR